MDLFRLTDPDELGELGWQELGGPDELVLVEWPDRAEGMLPEHRWEITLGPVSGDEQSRTVSVSQFGVPQYLPGFPVSVSI